MLRELLSGGGFQRSWSEEREDRARRQWMNDVDSVHMGEEGEGDWLTCLHPRGRDYGRGWQGLHRTARRAIQCDPWSLAWGRTRRITDGVVARIVTGDIGHGSERKTSMSGRF